MVKTDRMMNDVINYMDARRKEGPGNHEWDEHDSSTGNANTGNNTELCRNWGLGRCNRQRQRVPV